MREALYDKFGGLDDLSLGCTDFRTTGTGSRAGSKAAEMQRFLAKLTTLARRKGQNSFTRGEMRAVATEINLKVSDIGAFIDQLNDASELLSLGSGYYKVNANIDLGAPADSQAPGAQRLFSQRMPEGPPASQGGRGGRGLGRGLAGRRGSQAVGLGHSSQITRGRGGRGVSSQQLRQSVTAQLGGIGTDDGGGGVDDDMQPPELFW
uniref:MCM8/REC winged helix domain-containing protein n=1 Tax=Dunaliella tertiolecta TaxID=3047 RepID=A0A7S3QRU6_DUNTE